MPVDLTSSMTLEQIALEVARRCNLASYINAADTTDNRARVPSDRHDLEEVLSVVRRGYRRFLRDMWDATFMRLWVTITIGTSTTAPSVVNGEADTYRLPGYCTSAPIGDWQYVGGNDTGTVIKTMQYDAVAQMKELSDNGTSDTGTSLVAGHRRISQGGPERGWSVLFYPAPDATYTIQAEFAVLPYDLVELGDRHIAGAAHDDTIIAASVLEYKQIDEPGNLATYAAIYEAALAASRLVDNRSKPSNLGARRVSDEFLEPVSNIHTDPSPTVLVNGSPA